MAQRYKIHTKSQRELYREYKNLLRRTRRFKGTHVEVDNNIAKLLSEARDLLSLSKLTSKLTSKINKLKRQIHEMRGETLKSQYVSKPSVKYYVNMKTGEIVTESELSKIIINNYKELLKTICTSPSGSIYNKSGNGGYGYDALINKLDNEISSKGETAVALWIQQYQPPIMGNWKYDSAEQFDFMARIGLGGYDIEPETTDEETER